MTHFVDEVCRNCTRQLKQRLFKTIFSTFHLKKTVSKCLPCSYILQVYIWKTLPKQIFLANFLFLPMCFLFNGVLQNRTNTTTCSRSLYKYHSNNSEQASNLAGIVSANTLTEKHEIKLFNINKLSLNVTAYVDVPSKFSCSNCPPRRPDSSSLDDVRLIYVYDLL